MKTHEMVSTLEAFADLANDDRAEQLRKFAGLFGVGQDETVAARTKRIAKALKAQSSRLSYPVELKQSLAHIEAAFSASKAKQSGDFAEITSLFEGAEPGGSVDELVTRIKEALAAPSARRPRRAALTQPTDYRLATELASELARTAKDTAAFSKVLDKLRDPNSVSTATLCAVANRFLGKEKNYSGRKPAIEAISKRQRQDARNSARDKGVAPIGV